MTEAVKMFACDWCHRVEPTMWLFKWHNGIVLVEKWYCRFCIKHGYSPPVREVRKGGTVKKVTVKGGDADGE